MLKNIPSSIFLSVLAYYTTLVYTILQIKDIMLKYYFDKSESHPYK